MRIEGGMKSIGSVLFLGLVFLGLLEARTLQAFPELVRVGYANCITCHISANGAGVLTAYGRSLSSDVLSTWSRQGEDKPLYFIDQPEWLNLGGDLRALQLYQNRATRQNAQFIFMQADAEAAATYKWVTLDLAAGLDYNGSPISRRHYVSVRPMDQLNIRAGKFLPTVGINTENHSIALRRGIGRDQGTETYNVEGAWIDENFDVFATAILGRPDSPALGAEAGASLSSSIFLGNRYKIGASYYFGSRSTASRNLVGPFFLLGFTKHCFLMVDTAFQWFIPKATGIRQTGFADYARLDYEVVQGLHIYLTQEYSQLNFNDPNSITDAYGLGVQFFPRPHLEINTLYQRQRFGTNSSYADYLFAMFHFYI